MRMCTTASLLANNCIVLSPTNFRREYVFLEGFEVKEMLSTDNAHAHSSYQKEETYIVVGLLKYDEMTNPGKCTIICS